MKKSQRFNNTKTRFLQVYTQLKTKSKNFKRYTTIPFKIKQRQINISWKWGVFGIIAYSIYTKLEKQKDPVEVLQDVYGKRVKRIPILNQDQLWQNLHNQNQIISNNISKKNQIIHITPINQQQLASMINFCRLNNFHIIVGSFSIIPKTLKQVMPLNSQKQLKYMMMINIDQLKQFIIDQINHQIIMDIGCKCYEINNIVSQKGYQQPFMDQYQKQRVLRVVKDNLPLKIPFKQKLIDNLINMEMVSSQGINYMSSNVTHLGSVLNMNSLLIGSEGRYSIPAKVTIKLKKKKKYQQSVKILIPFEETSVLPFKNQKKLQKKNALLKFLNLKELKISNLNSSELANNLIKIKQKIENDFQGVQTQILREDNIYYIRFKQFGQGKFNIKDSLKEINQESNFIQKINNHQVISSSKNKENYHQSSDQFTVMYSVNQQMIKDLILAKNLNNLIFSYKGNLLKIYHLQKEQEIKSLSSFIILNGGNLVWCKNNILYNEIKKKNQGIQNGIQMMKKMKEIREALDPRRNFSCPDYQRIYFKKTLFRKMTQFFW